MAFCSSDHGPCNCRGSAARAAVRRAADADSPGSVSCNRSGWIRQRLDDYMLELLAFNSRTAGRIRLPAARQCERTLSRLMRRPRRQEATPIVRPSSHRPRSGESRRFMFASYEHKAYSLLLAVAQAALSSRRSLRRFRPMSASSATSQTRSQETAPDARRLPSGFRAKNSCWSWSGSTVAVGAPETRPKSRPSRWRSCTRAWIFISVNYRFVPEVPMDTIARDVAKSVRWAHDHAGQYGGDPNGIS